MNIAPDAAVCSQCGCDLRAYKERLFAAAGRNLAGRALTGLGAAALALGGYALTRREWLWVLLCGPAGLLLFGAGFWIWAHATGDSA